ncbi:hypothetical protein BpHYR1_007523 [Brachionus plicatilis]|uniref:Uncharacterized protein n=1 Tax=Brachionus plicatilis TaxID=10195 RepID=A0A3M7PTI8_BRAPC|nr:hypothetical protein BpHYR1_007523 [Brachionus plicatilis]
MKQLLFHLCRSLQNLCKFCKIAPYLKRNLFAQILQTSTEGETTVVSLCFIYGTILYEISRCPKMKVYSVELKRLTYEQVVEIFTEIEFPKSGDVIIFWSSESLKHNDWTTDGFKWKNQGTRKALIPTSPNDPAVYKNYYQMINRNKCINKEVIKDVYFFKDQAMPIIVHYLDKKTKVNSLLEYDSGPHGNVKSKENAENYQRTLPSVLGQIKENVSKRAPHLVYKETSKKRAVNKLKRFTYDVIANCHLMHFSLGFPNLILTAPDIRIICIDEELLLETKKAMAAFNSDNRICFQFDTPFNMTGYYVSVLS